MQRRDLARLVAVGRGQEPADLVLRGGRLVNVFTGTIEEADVALCGEYIAGVGPGYEGREVMDVHGLFLVPGYIDGHVHVESSYLSPGQYARAVVPRGTTTVISDLHEIANVAGIEGLRLVLDEARATPLELFLMAPSCVPCTDHLETSGARLDPQDIQALLAWPETLGLGEMMNFPGVLGRDANVLEKVRAAAGRPRDGHSPRVLGRDLNGYLAAGLASDHECTRLEEAQEKLARGMWIMIREGSSEHNLEGLLPVVNEETQFRCMLVVDDRTAKDILHDGDMDAVLRKAVRLGLPPVRAIRLATINPATYFGLRDHGAIAPGYVANIVALEDLQEFHARLVFSRGQLVARDGQALFTPQALSYERLTGMMRVRPVSPDDLAIPVEKAHLPAVGVIPGQIVTAKRTVSPRRTNGHLTTDPEHDVLKLVVVERHKATGNVGKGFVTGFGLRRGALGTSVAHDSHNIVVVGAEDRDILVAIEEITRMGGGLVAVEDGTVRERLPLPIAGLLSPEPLEVVAERVQALERLAREWGCTLPAPFAALSFLALPVIPEIKVTDKGLVDVEAFAVVG